MVLLDQLNPDSKLRDYIYFDTNDLFVKLIEYQIDSINEFMNKWRDHKNLYPTNIPEIYFYGVIANDKYFKFITKNY